MRFYSLWIFIVRIYSFRSTGIFSGHSYHIILPYPVIALGVFKHFFLFPRRTFSLNVIVKLRSSLRRKNKRFSSRLLWLAHPIDRFPQNEPSPRRAFRITYGFILLHFISYLFSFVSQNNHCISDCRVYVRTSSERCFNIYSSSATRPAQWRIYISESM